MPVDPLKVWQADKTRPLRARECGMETTCDLCDGPLSPGNWVVTLPARLGRAHTHCAGEKGWTIR